MTIKIKKSLVGKPQPENVARTGSEMRDWLHANGFCAEYVRPRDGWTRGHLCGRPMKDHDLGLCGVHKGIVTRRENARNERSSSRKRSESAAKRAERLAKVIGKAVGEELAIHYRVNPKTYEWTFTGGVVLTESAAEALVEILKAK